MALPLPFEVFALVSSYLGSEDEDGVYYRRGDVPNFCLVFRGSGTAGLPHVTSTVYLSKLEYDLGVLMDIS